MLVPQKITQYPLVSNIHAQVDQPTHISKPLCIHVSLNQSHGAQVTAAAIMCFLLLVDQCPHPPEGGQGTEKPLNGGEC